MKAAIGAADPPAERHPPWHATTAPFPSSLSPDLIRGTATPIPNFPPLHDAICSTSSPSTAIAPARTNPIRGRLLEPDAVQAQLDERSRSVGAMLTGTRLEDDLDDLLCCLGLMMPLARKSVEPLAAMTAPATVAAKHQCLLHFVGNAPWSDAALLTKVGELVLPAIERGGPIEAWIVDDTGFPKKGRHSVGVTRQYCGQLGKQDNCQVAVSLSLANHEASLPVAYRLYLPEDWATDQARRDKAKVPETIAFHTKPEIALEQIKAARTAGLPQGVVLMDAGYGNDTHLRTEISALGMSYVAAIGPNTSVWPAGPARYRRRPAPGAAGREAAAARWSAPTDHGQSACPEPAGSGMANDRLARRECRLARLALCQTPRAAGAS